MHVRYVSLVLLLSGCMTGLQATGTPEQIHELAKIKDATITCVIANTPYGKGSALFLSLDKGVLPGGGAVTVDDACKTTITSDPTK